MAKKGLIPPDRNAPSPSKTARTSIADPQRNQEKPTWRLRRMAFEGPFGWQQATGEILHEVRGKLTAFETMNWSEIDRAGDKHHYLTASKLSKEAKDEFKRLCDARLSREEELETVFSFRLSNKERVVGFRVAGLFDVVWWDPEHAFCPSEKKNT